VFWFKVKGQKRVIFVGFMRLILPNFEGACKGLGPVFFLVHIGSQLDLSAALVAIETIQVVMLEVRRGVFATFADDDLFVHVAHSTKLFDRCKREL
jgi:hypothetical protein